MSQVPEYGHIVTSRSKGSQWLQGAWPLAGSFGVKNIGKKLALFSTRYKGQGSYKQLMSTTDPALFVQDPFKWTRKLD